MRSSLHAVTVLLIAIVSASMSSMAAKIDAPSAMTVVASSKAEKRTLMVSIVVLAWRRVLERIGVS